MAYALRIKRKPLTFGLCLFVALGGLVLVDRSLRAATSADQITEIGQRHERLLSQIDRVVMSVRYTLARIDATGELTCDLVDASLRNEAILTVPGLKAIALVTSGGLHACDSPSYKLAAIAGDAIEPAALSAVDRFDVVKLADNGPLAFRLQRQPAASPLTLEAIVPIEDVFSLGSTDTDREIAGARTRLAFADAMWIDVPARLTAETGKFAAGPMLIDGAIASTAVPDGQQLVRTQSQALPLALVTSVPAMADVGLDRRRIIVNLSVASVLAALISIVFLRAPIEDFGPKRFLQAIRRNEFEIAYRPIVDLHSGKVAGAVVEMRWRRSGGIVLPSSDFMPAVIRSNFEAQLMQFALQKCDRDLAEAYRLRPKLQLKIALDHDTLIQPGFVDRLQRMLDRKGFRPSQLVVALTRIGEARAPEKTRDAMRQLQRMGVGLEIRQSSGQSDFGRDADDIAVTAVGIDSRVTLALEPPDQAGAAEARFWIRNIATVSAKTAIRICAYRVKSYEALKQLKALGVDEVEGPVLATPLSPGSYMALVARAEFEHGEATHEPGDVPARRKAASF